MTVPIIIHLCLKQLDFVSFLLERLTLKQEYVGIALVDSRRQRPTAVTLIRPAFQYVQSRTYQSVAFSGIKKCSVNHSVGHSSDSNLRSSIYAYHFQVKTMTTGHLRGRYSHSVVVGIHQINIFIYIEQ